MKSRVFFYRGYLQGLFIALLVTYVWFFQSTRSLEVGWTLCRTSSASGTWFWSDLAYLGGKPPGQSTRAHELSKPHHSLPQGHMLV